MGNLARLLKESWTLVEEQQDKVAGYFYARIFLSHPHLRDLFPVHMDVQRARLLGAIVTAVQTLDDPEKFDDYLRALGPRPPQVPRGTGALRGRRRRADRGDAARSRASSGASSTTRRGRDAYAVIAAKMLAGAEADTNPPYWYAEVLAHERRAPRHRGLHVPRRCSRWSTAPGSTSAWSARATSRGCGGPTRPANAPREDNTLEFHVRAVGAGWVSSALVRRLQVGDMIRLAAPMGSMTLDRRSTRDVVFVAGGTGLAPIKSLLEELTRYNRTRWVHVFFGARTATTCTTWPSSTGWPPATRGCRS